MGNSYPPNLLPWPDISGFRVLLLWVLNNLVFFPNYLMSKILFSLAVPSLGVKHYELSFYFSLHWWVRLGVNLLTWFLTNSDVLEKWYMWRFWIISVAWSNKLSICCKSWIYFYVQVENVFVTSTSLDFWGRPSLTIHSFFVLCFKLETHPPL